MTTTRTSPRPSGLSSQGFTNAALLVLVSLAVFDGARPTSFLAIPMVALGAAALIGHFTTPQQPRYRSQLRMAALIALVAILGASAAVAIDPAVTLIPQARLLLAWAYWLALFVMIGERALDANFRKSTVAAIGYAATAIAVARMIEIALFDNFGAGAPLLMTRNGYGVVLATLGPLAIVTWSQRSLVAGWATIALFISALIVNGSRGSWLAALVWIVVFLVAFRPSGALNRRIGLVVGAVLLLVAIVGVAAYSDQLAAIRERTLTFQDLNDDRSAVARLALQDKAAEIISIEPIVGIGAGNFVRTPIGSEAGFILPSRYWSEFPTWTPHNAYLELFTEFGVLGAIPILVITIGSAITAFMAVPRLRTPESIVDLGIAASVLSLIAYLWLIGGLATTMAWVILGLWAAAMHSLRSSRTDSSARQPQDVALFDGAGT